MSSMELNHRAELLHDFLRDSARAFPHHIAVTEPGRGEIRYDALAQLSSRVCDWLCAAGITSGDRVGLYLRKSIDAVAAIFGILKAGAVYVPLDPNAPVLRNAAILRDASAKAVVIERRFAGARECHGQDAPPRMLVLDDTGGGVFLEQALAREPARELSASNAVTPDDLAYVLYTSGSTGTPKGVALSHRNASSFIHWCSDTFGPRPEDHFSSHAPFHFDLSILDLYLAIKHGARIALIGEDAAKSPPRTASLIAQEKISIWYSTPSVLTLLVQYGNIAALDCSSVRLILFAGEVFPIKHFRALKNLLPAPVYYNLYGPTETNVCTFYRIPQTIPPNRSEPFPIGKRCAHVETQVIALDRRVVARGEEGELCVRGASVMQCYLNRAEATAAAFFQDNLGREWYATGDLVIEDADGNYQYLGRKDRMVKRRGYRVELGEIETCLYRHPAIKEAAVVAREDDAESLLINAFVAADASMCPTIIALKQFCAENLPAYMIPDRFFFRTELPKTSTDKIDYQKLASSEMAGRCST